MALPVDLPIMPFSTQKDWEKWLKANHQTSKGVALQFFKKNSGVPTVTYDEALEVALCYGWIDSRVNKYDEKSYLQRFTPRGPKSVWSKINTGHVERLIKEGRMQPAGMKAVEDAKADGRWERAYNSPANMPVPEDFLKALEENKKAKEFFETLNRSNKYAIAWELHNAKKPETRERRMKKYLEMMAKGEKLY